MFKPAPAADNDGKTFRAYLAIPFNGTSTKQDDVRLGFQMLQGIKHTDSGPLETFSDLSLFNISFNGHGLARTDVMSIDMIAAYNLISEDLKLGQAATGPANPFALAVIVGGTAAGVLCATGTICKGKDTTPAPAAKQPCNNLKLVANVRALCPT